VSLFYVLLVDGLKEKFKSCIEEQLLPLEDREVEGGHRRKT
jgi:hypothetical protein